MISRRVSGRCFRLFQGIQAVSTRTPHKGRNWDGHRYRRSMSVCYGMARSPRGEWSAIDGTASPAIVLSDVRCDVQLAQGSDESARVVSRDIEAEGHRGYNRPSVEGACAIHYGFWLFLRGYLEAASERWMTASSAMCSWVFNRRRPSVQCRRPRRSGNSVERSCCVKSRLSIPSFNDVFAQMLRERGTDALLRRKSLALKPLNR